MSSQRRASMPTEWRSGNCALTFDAPDHYAIASMSSLPGSNQRSGSPPRVSSPLDSHLASRFHFGSSSSSSWAEPSLGFRSSDTKQRTACSSRSARSTISSAHGSAITPRSFPLMPIDVNTWPITATNSDQTNLTSISTVAIRLRAHRSAENCNETRSEVRVGKISVASSLRSHGQAVDQSRSASCSPKSCSSLRWEHSPDAGGFGPRFGLLHG